VRTLVIGDSWASAVEADTGNDAGWPEIMGVPRELRLGVSGSTAAQWAADHEGWLTRAQQVEADAVIVSLMGNDGRHAMSDGRVTISEIAGMVRSTRAVVESVQRRLTIVLLYADPFGAEHEQSAMGVAALNMAIRWAGRGMPVVYAPTGDWLTGEHFDGRDIHPTRAGHEVIAHRMRELIEANAPRQFRSEAT